MKAERMDTWAVNIKDKPGGLTAKLEALAAAGVNLEFVIARRRPEKKGQGVVFVTPISGAAQCRAARKAGQMLTTSAVQNMTSEGIQMVLADIRARMCSIIIPPHSMGSG